MSSGHMDKRQRHGQVSIRDVAEAAGVSITTVSHVLNGKGRASEGTKKLVLAAAERAGYRPNPMASSLRTGRTGVLGIVFRPRDAVSGSLNGTEYHIRVAGGAATAALSRGYGLLHLPSPLDGARRVFPMDGCIIVGPTEDDPAISYFLKRGMPLVTIDREPGAEPRVPWFVRRDDEGGMRLLVEHLWLANARSFLLVSGRERIDWLIRSEQSFEAWGREKGVSVSIVRIDEASGAEGARDAVTLLLNRSPPDAILAATSRFAVGIIGAAQVAGHVVPRDIKVAALSDSELARGYAVPITALDLRGDEAGRCSIDLMLQQIENEPPTCSYLIKPELRLRASTARVSGCV